VGEKLLAGIARVELQATATALIELLAIAAVELLHPELLNVVRLHESLHNNLLPWHDNALHANLLYNDLPLDNDSLPSGGKCRHCRKGSQGEGENDGLHDVSPIKKG
jgi:hypothetical protein